jgi:hypothetical protein
MSAPGTDWALPAEVARFLRLEARDVEAMMRCDGLPYTTLPRAKRMVKRVFLRDLHAWLLAGTRNGRLELANFETFRKDFEKSRAKRGSEVAA